MRCWLPCSMQHWMRQSACAELPAEHRKAVRPPPTATRLPREFLRNVQKAIHQVLRSCKNSIAPAEHLGVRQQAAMQHVDHRRHIWLGFLSRLTPHHGEQVGPYASARRLRAQPAQDELRVGARVAERFQDLNGPARGSANASSAAIAALLLDPGLARSHTVWCQQTDGKHVQAALR